jgi:hypothetical protein
MSKRDDGGPDLFRAALDRLEALDPEETFEISLRCVRRCGRSATTYMVKVGPAYMAQSRFYGDTLEEAVESAIPMIQERQRQK